MAASSAPLLKFRDGAPLLVPEGLEAIRSLPGPVVTLIFMGDGRSGKSFLASRLLGSEDAFASDDSAEPVTAGIDVVTVPMRSLLQGRHGECSPPTDAAPAPPAHTPGRPSRAEDELSVLVLDCEGANNAMAAINLLVNVVAFCIATEVVFVANGMASEASLETLNASLAALMLVRRGEEQLPASRLTFLVNKSMLSYEDSALETMLQSGAGAQAAGRSEIRTAICAAFPERRFLTVPMCCALRGARSGGPDVELFEDRIRAFRERMLQDLRPLTFGGATVRGPQLASIVVQIVEQVKMQNEVNFPSMQKHIVFDGFLLPLVAECAESCQRELPILADYDADLAAQDPRTRVLERFEAKAVHVLQRSLVDEARRCLEELLDDAWKSLVLKNDVFGEQARSTKMETREVLHRSNVEPVGGLGPLAKVRLATHVYKIQNRVVLERKRGGEPVLFEWQDTRGRVARAVQPSFSKLGRLPCLKGRLYRRRTDLIGSIFQGGEYVRCMLQDGCLLWWALSQEADEPAMGTLNFLLHRATVELEEGCDSRFLIRPLDADGWKEPEWFGASGDRYETFSFEVVQSVWTDRLKVACCVAKQDRRKSADPSMWPTAAEWAQGVRQHLAFAAQAADELGEPAEVHRSTSLREALAYDDAKTSNRPRLHKHKSDRASRRVRFSKRSAANAVLSATA